jgi:hypothetical protein
MGFADVQPFQPPAYRAGTKGLFMCGDTTPDLVVYAQFADFGALGYTPPLLRQIWKPHRHGAFLRGYDGIDNLFFLGLFEGGSSIRIVYADVTNRNVTVDVTI